MMISIAIVDYGVGNIRSIKKALSRVGNVDIVVSCDHIEISSCDGVILPGVGAFAHAMAALKERNLDSVIKEYERSNKPILGICLGMQMLFDSSSEFGFSKGLGIIRGDVRRLPSKLGLKLPFISWSPIKTREADIWKDTILDDLQDGEDMYHVHSYHAVPSNSSNILSLSTYQDFNFCSTVKKGNVYGCQYHPEKSGARGLKIISNFLSQVRGQIQ